MGGGMGGVEKLGGMKRVVVGISGASAPVLGIRLLQVLKEEPGVETHLVISRSAGITIRLETPEWTLDRVKELADVAYKENDIAAAISSGSFLTEAMVIAPASMRTVAAVATGVTDNLLTRAADVILKERRRLIVVPRESPLHLGHLRNLTTLAELGAIIVPPLIALYHEPQTVQDMVDHTVGKILDLLGVEHQLFQRWQGA